MAHPNTNLGPGEMVINPVTNIYLRGRVERSKRITPECAVVPAEPTADTYIRREE
jgi:hypothetical protein